MQKSANCGRPFLYVPLVQTGLSALIKAACRERRGPAKMWRIMRLTILLLTVGFMHTYAAGKAQQVSINARNSSLKEVFSEVRKQTGFVVFANEQVISTARPVTVNVVKMPLQDLLDTIFAGQPLNYTIRGKTIFLSGKSFADPIRQPERITEAKDAPIAAPLSVRVVDPQGRPLSGATITSGRTGILGATNAEGRFNANLNEGDVLIISYVGYDSRRVVVSAAMLASSNELTITLTETAVELEDVTVTVNTGYQRIRPEQSTGAVSQITTRDFESRVSTSFIDGLVNRLPGLMINNSINFVSNGGASSRPLFNIRGISTMSANQSPLIVIDGYPTELTMDMIDPNEIKSVTILKDAAAATIYGVRASNGVIVIERKQAAPGKARFTFRATTGITPKEDFHRYRWADDASAIVMNYQKELYSRSINANTWGQLSSNSLPGRSSYPQVYHILAQRAANVITPSQAATAFSELEQYDNIDEYSRLFLRTGLTQSYNLNVSGGTPNALYYITANYTGNRQSQVKNNNNRILLSARSTLKLTTRLSLELTTDYQELNYNNVPVPGISSVNPYERFLDPSGQPAFITSSGISPYYNAALMSMGLENHLYFPLRDINSITDQTGTVNNRVTANFNYRLGAGFDFSFGGIYETSRSDMRYYAAEESSVARRYVNSYVTLNPDGSLKYNIPKGGYLRQDNARTTGYTARAQMNYNKQIGGVHTINGILGAEIRNVITSSNRASYFGYNDETLLQQPVDFTGISTGAIRGAFSLSAPFQNQFDNLFYQQYNEDRFVSGYSNIVYSYNNTYSLTGSIRIDQSNLFGTNPKYKYKPLWSIGAAWNLHNEDFMSGVDWVNNLKLRAAYGFNGNVAKMSLPQVIAQSVLNQYTSPASSALRPLSYANSSLRWEQTKNFNVGIDYRLFRNVSGTIDYYRKNSTDLLGNTQIDPTIGTSPSLINQATINNNGVEFSLRADWISTPKLNWNTGIVVARNTSRVVDVYQQGAYNPQTLSVLGYVKGYPVGALFAYRYGGLDSIGFPLVLNNRGSKYHTNSTSASSPQTIALSSDTSNVTRFMGTSIPTINAGLSNRVDIGNFYVFLMVNYYGGFKVRVPRGNPASTRPLQGSGNYWRNPGDELTAEVMALPAFTVANANNAYNYADSYVVNGDYLTIGDLTLSYRFDNNRWIRQAGFTQFEVKAQASNLWTIGLNEYNFSMATGGYQKSYITPTYTIGIFTNF